MLVRIEGPEFRKTTERELDAGTPPELKDALISRLVR
jgi:hypothetical protein